MNSPDEPPPLISPAEQKPPPVDFLALAVSGESPPPSPPGMSSAMKIAVGVTAVIQLLLGWHVSGFGLGADNLSFRFGAILAPTVVLPLIIIGLFSIGRRFRTASSRAVILLVVWGFSIFAHIGNLEKQHIATARARTWKPELKLAPIEPIAAPKPPKFAPLKLFVPSTPATYDFSPGSDQRLSKLIDEAHEERYHAVVAAYAGACADRPDDAVLPLERVKFIERFAYSEDNIIESASDDLKVAVDYLTARFPTAPGTVLYQLGNATGGEFEKLVREHRHLIGDWPAADRANFLLMQANSADSAGAKTLAQTYAARSFEADPSVAAGMLLAKAAQEANNTPECLRLLTHAVFDKAEPWFKKQKMDLLLDLKRADLAMGLYAEVKATAPYLVGNAETALRLAHAGKLAEARAILAEIKENKWTQQSLNRTRFLFELEFGNAEQARQSYRALRASGWRADPLLRDRLALFYRHRWLGWNLDDCAGALLLLGAVLGVLLAPALLFCPVHYWSLLRSRNGKTGSWPDASWGLREAWLTVGILVLADIVALWILQPEVIRTWWGDFGPGKVEPQRALLPVMTIVWSALGVCLGILVIRRKAWRVLGAGQWTVGKCLGVGVGLALILRMSIGIYVVFWPEAVLNELGAVSPQVQFMVMELLKKWGPAGLIGVVALFVPLLEEVLFRGLLMQAVAKHLPFGWANTGQAALFALVHQNLLLAPFFFAFGIMAGGVTRRCGGLLPAMVMHACNNLLVCLGVIFLQRLKH